MCVSVKYRRPNCWTDHDQIWHAYADRSGDGSYLKKWTPYPRGVEVGILGGQQIKSPGNVMNVQKITIKNGPTPPWGSGGGGGWGTTFQKSGKFHELPRKSRFFYPSPSGNFRGSKCQKSGKFHELPRKSIISFIPPQWEF